LKFIFAFSFSLPAPFVHRNQNNHTTRASLVKKHKINSKILLRPALSGKKIYIYIYFADSVKTPLTTTQYAYRYNYDKLFRRISFRAKVLFLYWDSTRHRDKSVIFPKKHCCQFVAGFHGLVFYIPVLKNILVWFTQNGEYHKNCCCIIVQCLS
jgi:hypothetical protein